MDNYNRTHKFSVGEEVIVPSMHGRQCTVRVIKIGNSHVPEYQLSWVDETEGTQECWFFEDDLEGVE